MKSVVPPVNGFVRNRKMFGLGEGAFRRDAAPSAVVARPQPWITMLTIALAASFAANVSVLSAADPAAGRAIAPAAAATTPAATAAAAGVDPLAGVRWAGPAVSLEQLRGKTVLLLVYASWCPKCNAWSGDLFTQLKQAIHNKPIVILAIYADKSPEEAQAYVTQRGFIAPNIIHGYDPTMPQKLGFSSNLFYYVLFDPEGRNKGTGAAGGYFEDGPNKRYSVAEEITRLRPAGQFHVLAENMSEPVAQLLWPFELGMGSEAALTKARTSLSAEQKKELDAAIDRYLDAQLEEIRAGYKGETAVRLAAYDKAVALSNSFRTTPQSKKAREVVLFMEKDDDFKRELAAKKAYDACAARTGPNVKRDQLFKAVAKRFEGTHYGRLAQEAAEQR